MEKLNWGWITYRRTSTTLQDGSRYYIAKIKAEHDAYNFTMIELPFFTKNIKFKNFIQFFKLLLIPFLTDK